ncbi:MAG: RHS repeat-associated core domain-containing protein, partial [Planctomycetota bacterium]
MSVRLVARYMDPDRGRFLTMDRIAGVNARPDTLHKYVYTANDPVNGIDPSGEFFLSEIMCNQSIANIIQPAVDSLWYGVVTYAKHLDISRALRTQELLDAGAETPELVAAYYGLSPEDFRVVGVHAQFLLVPLGYLSQIDVFPAATRLDLDIVGVTEPKEESPGGFICLNTNNCATCRREIKIQSIVGQHVGEVTLKLTTNGHKIRVYSSASGGLPLAFAGGTEKFPFAQLPRSLWVEGVQVSASQGDVLLTATAPGFSPDRIALTVAGMSTLKVTDIGTGESVTNPVATNMVVCEQMSGNVNLSLGITTIPSNLTTGVSFLWKIEGTNAVPSNGNFNAAQSIVLQPGTTDASRAYSVKAGCDANANGVLDAEEVSHQVDLQAVKIGPIDLQALGQAKEKVPPIPVGSAVQALVSTMPTGRVVTWSMEVEETNGPGRLVLAAIHPVTGVITVRTESGSGWIRIRATDVECTNCYAEARAHVGCSSCSTDGQCPKEEASALVQLHSVDVRISLGSAQDGAEAGWLVLTGSSLTPDMATPGALEFSTLRNDVMPIYSAANVLRQVVTPSNIVDIAALNGYTYEARFYRPAAATGTNADGTLVISGSASPFATWRVENTSASTTSISGLRVTGTKDGVTRAYEYSRSGADWILASLDGIQPVTRQRASSVNVAGDRVVTWTTEDVSGRVDAKRSIAFRTFAWGESVVSEVEDPNGAALATILDYHTTGPGTGRLKRQVNPDGSWTRYEYNTSGNVIQEISAWLDAPSTAPASSAKAVYYDYAPVDAFDTQHPLDGLNPRTVREEILGVVTRKTYHVYAVNPVTGVRTEIEEQAISAASAYGATGNLRTVWTYMAATNDAATAGRLQSVVYPDGRTETYAYNRGTFNTSVLPPIFTPSSLGKFLRTTQTSGTQGSPSGVALKTTRRESVRDPLGRSVFDQELVCTSPGAYSVMSWSAYTLDAFGRQAGVTRSDGAQSGKAWDCCGTVSETNEQGIATLYTYDALRRVTSMTKLGYSGGSWSNQPDIVTSYAYDAAGRRTNETMSGGSVSLSQRWTFDGAGRTVRQIDTAGLATEYAYAGGGRTTTITHPDSTTETSDNYLDGHTRSRTGIGLTEETHLYGVNPDGSQWSATYLGPLGTNSPVWEKATSDLLGRAVRTERPAFGGGTNIVSSFYNSLGQLVRTRRLVASGGTTTQLGADM